VHVFVNTLTYKNKAELLTKYCFPANKLV